MARQKQQHALPRLPKRNAACAGLEDPKRARAVVRPADNVRLIAKQARLEPGPYPHLDTPTGQMPHVGHTSPLGVAAGVSSLDSTTLCAGVKAANMGAASKESTDGIRQATLPTEEVLRMLTDPEFEPGPRPLVMDVQPEQWVFKEMPGRKRRSPGVGDKWVHTAGKKGARSLALHAGGPPVVRRRYGRVVRQQTKEHVFRYNLYTLIYPEGKTEVGQPPQESKTGATLWHIIKLVPRDNAASPKAVRPRRSVYDYVPAADLFV